MSSIQEKIVRHNEKFKLKFIEESHEYFIEDNKKLLSVTTKISQFFPFNQKKISREVAMKNWTCEDEVLEEWKILRDNGSYIHQLAEKYCKDDKLTEDEKQKIQHVINFFKENLDYEIVASEIQMFSKKYNVAGTVDLIVKDKKNKRLYIVDWKTSRKEIDKNQIFSMAKRPFEHLPNNKFYLYSMQLACYVTILKEEYGIEVWDSYIVHLRYDGTYSIIEPVNLLYEAEELLNHQ